MNVKPTSLAMFPAEVILCSSVKNMQLDIVIMFD